LYWWYRSGCRNACGGVCGGGCVICCRGCRDSSSSDGSSSCESDSIYVGSKKCSGGSRSGGSGLLVLGVVV
jgi:hypothetical protein